MEKIVINKVDWRIAKNGNSYAIISSGYKSLTYWVKNDYSVEKLKAHFVPGTVLSADINKNEKGFLTIGNFEWEINFKKDSTADTNETVIPKETEENFYKKVFETKIPYQLSIKEKIKNIREESETSSGDFFNELNIIIDDVIKNLETATPYILSGHELKLSAMNLQLSQRLSQNNAEARVLEVTYSNLLNDKTKEILLKNTTITKTEAKKQAEKELQQEKTKLIVSQNKRDSNQIINDGITQLVFAIKERIKIITK